MALAHRVLLFTTPILRLASRHVHSIEVTATVRGTCDQATATNTCLMDTWTADRSIVARLAWICAKVVGYPRILLFLGVFEKLRQLA